MDRETDWKGIRQMNFYTLTRKHDLFRNYKPSTRLTDYCPKRPDELEAECRGENVLNKTGGLCGNQA